MDCFSINLNSTVRVSLSAKEHLIPPIKHKKRYTVSYIMYFVTNGNLTLKLNGKKIEISKGQYYIFDKFSLHEPSQATDCEYFYIHFDCDAECFDCNKEEFLNIAINRNKKFTSYEILDNERYKQLLVYVPRYFQIDDAEAFEYLVNEFKKLKLVISSERGIEHRFSVSQGVASLFLKLERIVFDKFLSEKKNCYSQNPTAIKKLSEFIEKNFQKGFTSNDIEQCLSLSYDYANRIFKLQKGMSIVAYRNKLRIDKAKMLLITTDKSVEEIANETGFCDLYYFSKFFKKSVGVSPMHYKRGEHIEYISLK